METLDAAMHTLSWIVCGVLVIAIAFNLLERVLDRYC